MTGESPSGNQLWLSVPAGFERKDRALAAQARMGEP